VARHTIRNGLIALLVGVLVVPTCLVAAVTVDSSVATSAPIIRVRAFVQHAATASTNWSGYGIAGSFTSVSGSWTVPTVAPSTVPTYSSTWIGIDGLANRNLIQTGTESDFVNGHARYDAWWEVLPAAEKVIVSVPVNPGDHVSASIARTTGKNAGKKWTIVLTDTTSSTSFSFTRSYRGPGSSAEWIQERPQLGRTLSSLASYGSVTFSGITANGTDPRLTAAAAISMVSSTGTQVISAPSAPSALGDAFSVAFGALAPAAPPG